MIAYVRTKKITSAQYLSAQTKHGRRRDASSVPRMRMGATPGAGCDWPPQLKPTAEDPGRNYLAAHRDFLKAKAASLRKSATRGLHHLVGVSRAWVAETGDVHDAGNPRNQQLLEAAVAWANEWSGGGVFAARLDLDENGAAVVDVFVAPIREQRHKSGQAKPVVSVNKALEELSMRWNGQKGRHYSALNSSWADYAKQHLDPRLERGKRKYGADPDHVLPDVLRERIEACEAREDKARTKIAEAEKAKELALESYIVNTRKAARLIAGIVTGHTRHDPESRQWSHEGAPVPAVLSEAIESAALRVRDWWENAQDRVNALPDPAAFVQEIGQLPPEDGAESDATAGPGF